MTFSGLANRRSRHAFPRARFAVRVLAYGVPADLSGYLGSTLEKSSSGNAFATLERSLPVSHGLSEFSSRISDLKGQAAKTWRKRQASSSQSEVKEFNRPCHIASHSTLTPDRINHCKPTSVVCTARCMGLVTISSTFEARGQFSFKCFSSSWHC